MLIYCILPAYNEEGGISAQIISIRNLFRNLNYKYKFVVVNDGSTDKTADILTRIKRQIDIDLINHSHNLGPGLAFKSGFKHILPQLENEDIIITMDCDNTLDLNAIELMVNKVKQGHDVVLGSIFINGGRVVGAPLLRASISYAASLVYRAIFPIHGVRDYTAFFRAIKGSALKLIYAKYQERFIESGGFGCMAEMLLKFRGLPLSIAEIPMVVRYDLKTSSSKLKLFRTINEHFKIIAGNLSVPMVKRR